MVLIQRHLYISTVLVACCVVLGCVECMAQTSLTAWWAFDEDYSSEVNNSTYAGTAIGSGTTLTGIAGQFVNGTGALNINGTQSPNYVAVGSSPISDPNASISVSAWYQYNDIDNLGSDTRNFVWETAPSNFALSFGIRSDTVDGRKRAQWYTESPAFSNNQNAGPVINEGTWYHAAVVINQDNNSLQYYHNGTLIDDERLPSRFSIPSGIEGFNIGNHRSGDGTRNWDGYIDDVAVFQGALSQSDVAALYDRTETPLSIAGGDITDPPPGPPEPLPFVPGSWTMVVIPDTQVYQTLNNGIFPEMTQWIVDNRDEYDIGLVQHVGDITEFNDRNNNLEWRRAKAAIQTLDGQVPYILSTGNHDYGPNGRVGDRSTSFNDFFDESLYHDSDGGQVYDNLRIAEQFVDTRRLASGQIDRSLSPDGKTLENVAFEFTAPDGRELLVFSLEWGARQEVVDWANVVAGRDEYADHTAVLLTHAYMYGLDERYDWSNQNTANDEPGNTHSGSTQIANPHTYGTAATNDRDPANDTNDGEELWRELVSQHGNFELTLNGHVVGAGGNQQLGFRQDPGANGQTVHQMLFNAQSDANGGDGWMRLLEFLPDGQTVQVKTYSPYRDRLGLNPWRTDPQNQFVISLTPLPSSNVPEPSTISVFVVGASCLIAYHCRCRYEDNPTRRSSLF